MLDKGPEVQARREAKTEQLNKENPNRIPTLREMLDADKNK